MNKQNELQINQPLRQLMESCETHCIAGCCGLNAFDVSEQQIGEWVKTVGVERAGLAGKQLQGLIDGVATCGAEVTSELFNAIWPTADCIAWLNEWKIALEGVLQKTK